MPLLAWAGSAAAPGNFRLGQLASPLRNCGAPRGKSGNQPPSAPPIWRAPQTSDLVSRRFQGDAPLRSFAAAPRAWGGSPRPSTAPGPPPHPATPCGTRTRNLRIRGPTPCPLGQGGFWRKIFVENPRARQKTRKIAAGVGFCDGNAIEAGRDSAEALGLSALGWALRGAAETTRS